MVGTLEQSPMILIGLGSNVAGPWGTPRQTLERAIASFSRPPLALERASAIIQSEPWGKKDQPVYANAVARIRTRLQPLELLAHLRQIEVEAGRQRRERWGERTLDLDDPSVVGKYTASTRVILSFGAAYGGFEFAMQLRSDIMERAGKPWNDDPAAVYLDHQSLKNAPGTKCEWDVEHGIHKMSNAWWKDFYKKCRT